MTPSLCCFPIGDGSVTHVLIPEFLGIPTNSVLLFDSGNSGRNWTIEWLVKQISVLLHLLIPEFPEIPTNSHQFLFIIRFREFRAELDDRMASQTNINSITSSNSDSKEFLLILFWCNSGIRRNSVARLGIRVDEFRNCWN